MPVKNNNNKTKQKNKDSLKNSEKKTNKIIRKTFRDYVTEKKLKHLINKALKKAETDDKMLMFVLEHVLGKAPQPIENVDEKPFLIKMNI